MYKQYINMVVSSIDSNIRTKEEIESNMTDVSIVVDFISNELDKYLASKTIQDIGCNKVGLGLGYGVFIDEDEVVKAGLDIDDIDHRVDSRRVLKDIVSIDVLGPNIYLDLYNEDHLRIYYLEEIGLKIPKPDIEENLNDLETNKRFIVSHSEFVEELFKRGLINKEYKQYMEDEYKELRKYPGYECWINLNKQREKQIENSKVLKKDS